MILHQQKFDCRFKIGLLLVGLMSILLIPFTGCEKANPVGQTQSAGGEAGSKTKRIMAVSYPLQFLTQWIAGEDFHVDFLAPLDSDPQTWRPSRDSIGQMQNADLVIANGTGATYAKWMTIVSLPDSKIRNTASRGLSLKDFIAVEDVTIVHSHGPEGEHSHPTMVARTWLDPAIAKKQAIYIADELAGIYPESADNFQSNLEILSQELDDLSALLKVELNSKVELLTATPKSKFLARAVGLNDQHLTWFDEPNVEKAESDLVQLEIDSTKPGVIVFDSSLPSKELVGFLERQNLKPIALNLIDHPPAQGDFLTELRANVEKLTAALNAASSESE
jgi:zinc transport system substrate-binding protein